MIIIADCKKCIFPLLKGCPVMGSKNNAACFICYDNKELEEKYFSKISSDDYGMKYYNVLDFCYEMDTLNFRKNIILPYLKYFIEESKKYFQQEYFCNFNSKYIRMAQHLMILNLEISVMKKSFCFSTDEVVDRLRNTGKKRFAFKNNEYYYYFFWKDISGHIYKIIVEKIPEIIEKINLEKKLNDDIQCDIECEINDDINNPINKNEETFSKIIGEVFIVLFPSDKILVYDKCKNLIEEIESENNFANDDIFDL